MDLAGKRRGTRLHRKVFGLFALGFGASAHGELMKSTAAWAIFPLQDILGLGSEARMNRPSTLGGNWTWRMAEGSFTPELARDLAEMSRLYGRNLD